MQIVTGAQVRMGRAALSWGVRELAEKAGVMPNTVSRVEGGSPARVDTLTRIVGALQSAGIVFIPENGGGPGIRFRDIQVQIEGSASLDRTRDMFKFSVLVGADRRGMTCVMPLKAFEAFARINGIDAEDGITSAFERLVGPLGQIAAKKIRSGEIGADQVVRISLSDAEHI